MSNPRNKDSSLLPRSEREREQDPRRSQTTVSASDTTPRSLPDNPSVLFPRTGDGASRELQNYELNRASPGSWAPRFISALARDFLVTAPLDDFKKSEKFLRENPRIISQENSKAFMKEAIDALSSDRQEVRKIAQVCIEKCVILQRSTNISPNSPDSFVRLLALGDRKTKAVFEEQFSNMEVHCREEAQKIPRPSARTQQAAGPRQGQQVDNLSSQMRGVSISSPAPTDPSRRHEAAAPTGPRTLPKSGFERSSTLNFSGQTTLRADPRFQQLDQSKWGGFFIFGKVFAIMTFNENSSADADDEDLSIQSVRLKSGEDVQAKVRRMVVVEKCPGYCWAIPIFTYRNKGLAKPGFREEHVAAHARIHIDGSPAQWERNEPRDWVTKRDIVVAGHSSSRLHHTSRVNFEKPYSVEFNAKVMSIGRVAKDSMPYFETYWKEVLQRRADRRSHSS